MRLHKYAPEVTGDAMKSKFIEGLRDDLKYQVKGSGCIDFLDAVAKAENYEKMQKYQERKSMGTNHTPRLIATGHRHNRILLPVIVLLLTKGGLMVECHHHKTTINGGHLLHKSIQIPPREEIKEKGDLLHGNMIQNSLKELEDLDCAFAVENKAIGHSSAQTRRLISHLKPR